MRLTDRVRRPPIHVPSWWDQRQPCGTNHERSSDRHRTDTSTKRPQSCRLEYQHLANEASNCRSTEVPSNPTWTLAANLDVAYGVDWCCKRHTRDLCDVRS